MQELEEQHTTYVADTPISDPDLDKFDRWPFAQRIGQTIAAQQDPGSLVVGIFGDWGEGKTTVLNFIEHELNNHDHVITLKFNPWRFHNEELLLKSFFESLADALEASLTTRVEDAGALLKKYGGLLSLSVAGFSLEGFKDIGEALSTVDVDELRNRISTILAKEGKRIVIFLDDIDRLDKAEIQAVFRLVKLSADFDYTTYILAFDDAMVAAALQEKYATGGTSSGQNFLEKIIQVPLHLPKASTSALVSLCVEAVNEALQIAEIQLTEDQSEDFWHYFNLGLRGRLSTPRMVKRYGNALLFALPILKGEVNPIDLIAIEGIRVFFPIVYENIRDNREAYLANDINWDWHKEDDKKKKYDAIRKQAIQKHSERDQENIIRLLEALFPRTGDQNYGESWEETWSDQQRVASSAYFDRYFSYAVKQGDVSDQALSQLIDTAESGNETETYNVMHKLLTLKNAESFIAKCRDREENLSPDASRNVSKALALLGDRLPHWESSMIPFSGPLSQGAILIYKLIKNISDVVERYKTAVEIIQTGNPLHLIVEVLRWLHTSDEDRKKADSEQDILFTVDQESSLREALAKRIRDLAEVEVLYKAYPDHARKLFAAWRHGGASQEEISTYLSKHFASTPSDVFDFLMLYRQSFVPMTGPDTGKNRKGGIEAETYRSIQFITDPQIVIDALVEFYGPEITNEVKSVPRTDSDPNRLLARQFMFHHHAALARQEGDKHDDDSSN